MKPRTAQHLTKADANMKRAQLLADEDPPADWAVVVAFYAAVHYVGALLWEQGDYTPINHRERGEAMHLMRELRPVEDVYDRLNDLGWKARYLPALRVSPTRIETALGDMVEIRTAVFAALGVI